MLFMFKSDTICFMCLKGHSLEVQCAKWIGGLGEARARGSDTCRLALESCQWRWTEVDTFEEDTRGRINRI